MHQTYQPSPVARIIAKVEAMAKALRISLRPSFPKRGRRLHVEMVNTREALESVQCALAGEIDNQEDGASICADCREDVTECTCNDRDLAATLAERVDIGFCRDCDETLADCRCYAVEGRNSDDEGDYGYYGDDAFDDFMDRMYMEDFERDAFRGHPYIRPHTDVDTIIRGLVYITDSERFAQVVDEINLVFGTDYDVDSIKQHPAFWEGIAMDHTTLTLSSLGENEARTGIFYAGSARDRADLESAERFLSMIALMQDEPEPVSFKEPHGHWVDLTGGRVKRIKARRGDCYAKHWHYPSRLKLVEQALDAAAAEDLERDSRKRTERNEAAARRAIWRGYTPRERKTAVYDKSRRGRIELVGNVVHTGRRGDSRFEAATLEDVRRDRRQQIYGRRDDYGYGGYYH